jgi:LacI family transcriptional regulator
MYTIRDVARLADVSITTASAVINGKRTVKEALRLRVIRAMEALDYHPDSVARSLKVRRTNTVGIVVPDVTNPFYPEIMRPMEDVARRSGYSVIFCDSNEDRELERSQLSTLFSRRVDGVVIAPADPYAVRDRLMRRRLPFVLFDRVPANFPGAAVVTDNFEASRNAVRYLIGLGHERIGIVIHGAHLAAVVDRLEGFKQALKDEHLAIREEYIRRADVGDLTLQSACQCGVELLRLPDPPTAIFCGNNRVTLGVMRALGELRVPCPERVSVLGFDDFDWAASSKPRITTVAQPTYEIGKQAMQLLVQKMEDEKDGLGQGGSHLIVLPCQLRIRDSTAPPPRPPAVKASRVAAPESALEHLNGVTKASPPR